MEPFEKIRTLGACVKKSMETHFYQGGKEKSQKDILRQEVCQEKAAHHE